MKTLLFMAALGVILSLFLCICAFNRDQARYSRNIRDLPFAIMWHRRVKFTAVLLIIDIVAIVAIFIFGYRG